MLHLDIALVRGGIVAGQRPLQQLSFGCWQLVEGLDCDPVDLVQGLLHLRRGSYRPDLKALGHWELDAQCHALCE